jgi:hypothetical protein
MKKLKSTKELRNDIEHIELLLDKAKNKLQEINKEYAKNINKLLEEISKGENLDIKMLKGKYLKSSSKLKVESVEHKEDDEEQVDTEYDCNDTQVECESQVECELQVNLKQELFNDSEVNDIIFDKIIIDGTNYYYENKENGKIYDTSSNIVGIYKDKTFTFSKE